MFKDFLSYHAWARGTIDARLDKDADLIHFSDFMRYMIKGGKRLRGTLCLLISQALGGDSEESLPYACAIEMVHAATLAHDDFIDGHGTRRGRIPLYRVLDPRRAVLLADMLLSTSAHRVASLGSTDGYQTLTKAIYEVSRGVFYEPLNPVPFIREIRSGKIEKRLYRVLIRLKTAELFGAACKLGAIAAGADVSDRLRAYSYGIAVGEAFQVADDLVDILI
ncbi:MAG: polyprenyl synthetase family protein, partial [Candidatus Bathyarchaeia archaeon]